MARKTVNILFSSSGRRVELMRAFRRAYSDLGLEGKIVAADTNPLAPTLQCVDRAYVVPPYASAENVPTLVEICRREKIDMIFPLTDPDVAILADNREQLERTGATVFAISAHMVEVISDKWKTNSFFAQHEIPTARTWLPGDHATDANFPLFIKPRRGSASQHTFIIRSSTELDFFCKYVPQPIIQEYLPGPEITNDVMCDAKGNLLSIVSRQRIEVRAGEVIKSVTIRREDVHVHCIEIAKALHTVGPITI